MTEGAAYVGKRVKMRDGDSRAVGGADFYDGAGQVIGYQDAVSDVPKTSVLWDDGEWSMARETNIEPAPPPAVGTYDAVFIPYLRQLIPPGSGAGRALVDGEPEKVIAFESIHRETGERFAPQYHLWRRGGQRGVYEYLYDQQEHPLPW